MAEDLENLLATAFAPVGVTPFHVEVTVTCDSCGVTVDRRYPVLSADVTWLLNYHAEQTCQCGVTRADGRTLTAIVAEVDPLERCREYCLNCKQIYIMANLQPWLNGLRCRTCAAVMEDAGQDEFGDFVLPEGWNGERVVSGLNMAGDRVWQLVHAPGVAAKAVAEHETNWEEPGHAYYRRGAAISGVAVYNSERVLDPDTGRGSDRVDRADIESGASKMSERRFRTACGDSREILKTLADNSIDAVVTDPPYDLTSGKNSRGGFMRSAWDATGIAFDPELWQEVLRGLKPGGFAICFGGARTYHRMVCAMEDAGFSVKEGLVWLHSQGMPKHKNGLKPAFEPLVLCQKPFKGSVERNVAVHGTGALNIDACRIGRASDDIPGWHSSGAKGLNGFQGTDTFKIHDMSSGEIQARCGGKGRWPASVLLEHHEDCVLVGTRKIKGCPSEVIQGGKDGGGFDIGSSDGTRHTIFQGYGDEDGMEEVERWACTPECAVRALDDMVGNRKSGKMKAGTKRANTMGYAGAMPDQTLRDTYGDSGNVSRFFYCAKPSRREKNAGVPEGNKHPTTKSVTLCRYLTKLITPPGGTVLDVFAGSGSIGVAALAEGFKFLGIEREEEYYVVMRARLAHAEEELNQAP